MPFLGLTTADKRSKQLLRMGTFRKPRRLLNQDYTSLMQMCQRSKKLFVDESFPADAKSIGFGALLKKLPANIQWKRPHEIEKNPQFFASNASRFDVHQGLSENCWFLAALASLTFHQDILANVVPKNQSFDDNYCGIFHFRFWRFGEWVDVVVDDQLPVTEDGRLIFVSSIHKNLFWGALLEKAYAKVCGSYEDMQIGQVSEALVDFTGGVNISIKLDEAPTGLWDILLRAAYSGSLMGCQTLSGEERILENGLVAGHAYTLTGIRKVTGKCGPEYLVRLRNPWGKIEWKGDWSDCSPKWDQLSLKERVLLRRTREDGEFWMSLEDFKTHFVELVICKLTPDLMSAENGKKWMLSMQSGSWVTGESAGGRLSFRETFWTNPQFRLKIKAGDSMEKFKGSCNVLVSLLQKQTNMHRNQSPPLYIGFSIFKVPHEYQNEKKHLPRRFFNTVSPVNLKCIFINEREVTQDFHLVPGDYVIVPSTADPNQECEFIMRVFSRKHTLQAPGEQLMCQKEISDKHDEKIWEDHFTEFFQHNPEVNVGQLQTLLNKKNWSNSSKTAVKFSLEGCKVVMAQLDLDTSGTLSLQEFRSLWKRLIAYQDIFQKRDISKSGYISLNDLQAIAEAKGIKLSHRFMNLMVTRYGNASLKLTFENFVCFMLRMEINGEMFHNLSRDGKGIYLQESEWMMLTMYS